jgi:hypothetical protein
VSSEGFGVWVESYIAEYDIELIIPGGSFTPGGHPVFNRHKHLFPLSADPTVLARGRKFELFECLLSGEHVHNANLPPTLLIDLDQPMPEEQCLARLPFPVFIKLDAAHARAKGGDRVVQARSPSEARASLESLSQHYRKAVVQGYVHGVGVGVFLLRWRGEVRARFMHRRLHEMPHTGGASSLRESWWHAYIASDAEAKLDRVNWDGVAMVEYRWDSATDRFFLMEMNLRFWGSIHLALYAGVDFPALLADSFFGKTIPPQAPPRLGLKCRNTIPYELGYLVSLWRDQAVPISRKLFSLWEALVLSLDWRVKNDLLFPGDRGLFLYRLGQFLRTGQ